MPIFLLTALMVDKSALRDIDKIRRGMLWACKAVVSGGKRKVNWAKVCLSKGMGGLDILVLERFTR
jgi:hypothetical protein